MKSLLPTLAAWRGGRIFTLQENDEMSNSSKENPLRQSQGKAFAR